MAELVLAALAPAAQNAAPGITAAFECEMERGSIVTVEKDRVSVEDRAYLPARWKVTLGTPGGEDKHILVDDPVLGHPVEAEVDWGYQHRFFDGRVKIVHGNFDWWQVDYGLSFTGVAEAEASVEYFRTVPGNPPHSYLVHGYGTCHEMLSIPARKPS